MKCQYSEVNDKVFERFCSAGSKNRPVTGPLLQGRALINTDKQLSYIVTSNAKTFFSILGLPQSFLKMSPEA